MPISENQIVEDFTAYKTYRDDTNDWRETRDKCEKFVVGAQYSKDWSDEIRAREQSDIVLNRIRPLLITRISAMVAQKPSGVVYGTRKEDIPLAQVLNEFIDWHWYKSLGSVVMERVVSYQQKHGIGWFILYSDNLADLGRGELRIGDLKYRNVFVDKAAGAHPLFDDAPVIIVTKLRRPLEYFSELPPKIREKIQDRNDIYCPNDEIHWESRGIHAQEIETGVPISVSNAFPQEKANYIRVLDIYRRKVVNVRCLRQKLTGKIYKILEENEKLHPEEELMMQKRIADAQLLQIGAHPKLKELLRLEEVEVPMWRVHYYQQLSGAMVVPESEEMLPITHYPVIPVVGEDTGNAMPLSEVDFMIGQQEMLNTAVSLTLLNAALASNWRVLIDSGRAGITDLKKFQRDFSIPGSWHNLKTDPATGRFPIEIMRPEPLPQAWFSLMQYFAQSMEFQLSTFSFRTGDPSKAPETLGATLQLGQWAQDVLRIPLGRLEIAVERMFDTLLEWMPNYYNYFKQFEMVGADGNVIQRAINQPFYNDESKAWETINDLGSIKANYRIRLGSTTPAQTVYSLQVMQSLAQMQPALIGNVIDLMPGLRESEKSEIKETLNQVMQLSQSNQQKDQVIQALQTQLNRLQETVVALQREKAIAKVEPEIAAFVADMRHMKSKLNEQVQKSGRSKK